MEICRQRVIAELAEECLVFARHEAIYDQIRFLDLEGREALRVNWNAGPAVVPVSRDSDPRGAEAAGEPLRRRGGLGWQR